MSQIDIGLKVLDHQILDRDGRRCGNVDDVEIEGGPGVWPQRAGWIGRLASWIGGGGRTRIPWEEVADIESHVRLRKTAEELGLGRGDDRVRTWIEKIPGAHR